MKPIEEIENLEDKRQPCEWLGIFGRFISGIKENNRNLRTESYSIWN